VATDCPNGFFRNGLLAYGQGLDPFVPMWVAKGFIVECPDRANASDQFNVDFHGQVRRLLHMLGGQYRMQLCWSVDSNYRDELVEYARETERDCSDAYPRQIRTATFLKFHDAMERRELRRERLHLYVSKKITARAPIFTSSIHKDDYYRKLFGEYQREFELFQTGLTNLFAPSNVRFTPLDDHGHFTQGLYYLNPAYAMRKGHDPLPEFKPGDSMQENWLRGALETGERTLPSYGFQYHGLCWNILTIRRLPDGTDPKTILLLTQTDLLDYSITTNLYPADKDNFHEILMSIVGITVIVILLNGYPTALTTVADGFKTLREQTTASAPGGQTPTWEQVFDVTFEHPSWNQFVEKAEIALCQVFKWIGKISIWFLDLVQSWAFNGLIAISPILIGALAVPWTQGTGITFLTTSFGIAAWHLGIALVDILLASAAGWIFAGAVSGGAITAATVISLGGLPIFLGALVAFVLIAITLYLAVPLVMAAVLRGQSPLTTAATSGMQMALTALGLAGMAGTRLGALGATAGSKSSENPGKRDGGGEESTGMAPQPSTTPTSGPAQAARGQSSATAAESTGESAAERQSQILSDYESAGAKTRTAKTRRATETAALEGEEKAYL
jgi:type II secretory pathway pseudopilin PulG